MAKAFYVEVTCNTEEPEQVAHITDVLTRMAAGLLLDGIESEVSFNIIDYDNSELFDQDEIDNDPETGP